MVNLVPLSDKIAIATCKKKEMHETRKQAETIAARRMLLTGIPLYVYNCKVCGGYHLTKIYRPEPCHQTARVCQHKDVISSGMKFGRFTVLHKAMEGPSRYACACECGAIELRSSKAIRNKNNKHDACKNCREIVYKARMNLYARTGVDVDYALAFHVAFCGREVKATGRVVNGKPVLSFR